jgi:serine/threonine-protein kinase RsbW
MRTLKFTIDSDYNACGNVHQEILDEVTRQGYDTESIYGIRLALMEALVNAAKHGNRLDTGKRIEVEAKITPKRIVVTIEDEGTGFDRKKVPDPTLAENLIKSHGRGILLIESYMDKVRWSHGGRRLTMERKNGNAKE